MNKPKILIVDDEPFNVDYLEQELNDLEYETISAGNGQKALDLVYSEAPDLVLLDIMMPIMDGFEVLSRMKADVETRDIPVIVISATADINNVVRGIKLGAEDYLPKPFDPIFLHARVSSSLDKKRLRDLQKLYLKSLERELDIAREIQQGFLPAELPQVEGWEVASCFKAAREVAGDFYDAFELPDGKLVCVIGDVCGKGVGAALFMTLFRSLIRATATTDYFLDHQDRKELTAAERLQHVVSFTNNYVAVTHEDANMFATAFVGIFDQQNGNLSYVNAGNEPPLLVRDRKIVASLDPSGPVIGVISEAQFQVKEIVMEPDDVLLAFTDGITDALNVVDEAFGIERLRQVLIESGTSPAELLERMKVELCHYIGEAAQFDDITMLAVRRIA